MKDLKTVTNTQNTLVFFNVANGSCFYSKYSIENNSFSEVKQFALKYNKLPNKKPLVVIPTTYSGITEKVLIKHGVNIVIYANQLLRAAYPAMINIAKTILKNGRAKEADKYCMNVKDIISLIPGAK